MRLREIAALKLHYSLLGQLRFLIPYSLFLTKHTHYLWGCRCCLVLSAEVMRFPGFEVVRCLRVLFLFVGVCCQILGVEVLMVLSCLDVDVFS